MAKKKLTAAEINALCARHGVEIDKTDAFKDFPGWEPEDAGKYCVTVPAGIFEEAIVRQIPLANTPTEAKKLAVQHLGLHARGARAFRG